MGLEILAISLTLLLGLWLWLARPITSAARRQLRREIETLRRRIRACEEALTQPDISEDTRREIEGARDGCRRSLEYRERKLTL